MGRGGGSHEWGEGFGGRSKTPAGPEQVLVETRWRRPRKYWGKNYFETVSEKIMKLQKFVFRSENRGMQPVNPLHGYDPWKVYCL